MCFEKKRFQGIAISHFSSPEGKTTKFGGDFLIARLVPPAAPDFSRWVHLSVRLPEGLVSLLVY
jgi:hypothetical protein